MHTVRNGIVLTLRRDSLNLRWNLSLYSVLASYTLRFEDLEESWEAMAELVMLDAVFSDVAGIPSAIIFRFQHLMWILGEEYRFQMPTWSRKASPRCRTWGEKDKSFFSTSNGQASSRHRFEQPRNQFRRRFGKKSDLHIPPFMWSQSDMIIIHPGRQRETRPALGPKGLIVKARQSGLWDAISLKTTSCNHSSWYSHTNLYFV